jgi:transposase
MKKYQFFVGIDVAKNKLDICIINDPNSNKHLFSVAANDAKGIAKLIAFVNKQVAREQVLFCLENTGVYSMPLCYWLQKNKLDYWVVPALEVKKAKGITRGKTDKADARDIAYYAITHQHHVHLTALPEDDLIELRLLLAEREKLIKAMSAFKATREAVGFLPKEVLKTTLSHNKKTIALLQSQLVSLEKLIDKMMEHNLSFKQQAKLLVSVPGIGKQTAVNLIAFTHAFSNFKTWRQFACYAGIAPFEYSSGSSIRGKTKLNHIANKKLKSLLHLAALSAKRHDGELKKYFERKVAEGKNKMLVMNAIRCKVLSRAFAVIGRNTPFVNVNKFAA